MADTSYFDDPNSLRSIAKKKGYNVTYDSNASMVSVANPTNSKSITFKSGAGQEYGMGGLTSGYNSVSDMAKLDMALSAVPAATGGVGAAGSPGGFAGGVSDYYGSGAGGNYESAYKDDVDGFLTDIKEWKPYDYTSYDPEKDAGFTAYRDKATAMGNTAYGSIVAGMSTPGLQESSLGRQVAETARAGYLGGIRDAIPEFMDKARQDYNAGLENKYNALNAHMDVDTNYYNRFSKDRDFAYGKEQDFVDNTGYMPVNTSSIPADSPLRKIPDYQAEINKRAAANPNDPLIPVLEALRYEKVMGSPDLSAKYGSTVKMPTGMRTMDREESEFDRAMKESSNDLDWQKFEFDKQAGSGGGGGSGGSGTSDEDLGVLMQGMIDSGNPQKWLEENVSWLGENDYKTLAGYAKNMTVDNQKIFAGATPEQKNSYNELRSIYLEGKSIARPGSTSSTSETYAKDPATALRQLESQPMNRKLLGPLYQVLHDELSAKIKSPPAKSDPVIEEVEAKMAGSSDPVSVVNKYKREGKLNTTQYQDLLKRAAQIKSATPTDDDKNDDAIGVWQSGRYTE